LKDDTGYLLMIASILPKFVIMSWLPVIAVILRFMSHWIFLVHLH